MKAVILIAAAKTLGFGILVFGGLTLFGTLGGELLGLSNFWIACAIFFPGLFAFLVYQGGGARRLW